MSTFRLELVSGEHRALLSLSMHIEEGLLRKHVGQLRKLFSLVPSDYRKYQATPFDEILPQGEWMVFIRSLVTEGVQLKLLGATRQEMGEGFLTAKQYARIVDTPPDLTVVLATPNV